MNIGDTFDLLTAVATRDQRTVGQADVAAWATDLADVTLDEALHAVTAFNRSEAAQQRRIKAADIVQWTKRTRRDAREVGATVEFLDDARDRREIAQGAARQITSGGVDPHRGARNSTDLESLHVEAMLVPCPAKPTGCGVPADERCVNHAVHDEDGRPMATKIPHTKRSVVARNSVEARGDLSALRS